LIGDLVPELAQNPGARAEAASASAVAALADADAAPAPSLGYVPPAQGGWTDVLRLKCR
jgi:hypothetical protein